MAFADNLRRLRLTCFLSQAELARRAGLHAVTVTRLEAGTTAPTTRTVRGLADALGVEPRELAMPAEAAEARRILSDALDIWNNDGGAAQAETGNPDGSLGRIRLRADTAQRGEHS